jgi:L-ribulose-5-phosphate 3-epimerase
LRRKEETDMAGDAPPFAINTYAYTQSHAATDCLSHLAAQGYGDFELMMYPGHLWPAHTDAAARRALRAFVEGADLRLVSLNMPNIDLNVAGASDEMRRYTLGILHGVVELAGDLGVPGVVIGPGKSNPLMPLPREVLLGHFFRALDELAPHAERVGTRLYVENMPFAFLPDAAALMAALERYGDPRVLVIYDIANGYFIGEDLRAGLLRVKQRLALVHLSDTPREVYRHSPVGEGSVPFAEVPAILEEVGYGDLPMLEIISEDPDRTIAESVERLIAMGWPKSARRPAGRNPQID